MPYDQPAIASVGHAVNYHGVCSELPARKNTLFDFTSNDSPLNQSNRIMPYTN